jgi:hypothetical protein
VMFLKVYWGYLGACHLELLRLIHYFLVG